MASTKRKRPRGGFTAKTGPKRVYELSTRELVSALGANTRIRNSLLRQLEGLKVFKAALKAAKL